MILEAGGAVQLHSPRGDSARPAPQAMLYPDDRLTLAADAQVQLVFLSDLHKQRLQAGREATIGRNGCLPAAAVRENQLGLLPMIASHCPCVTSWTAISKSSLISIFTPFFWPAQPM